MTYFDDAITIYDRFIDWAQVIKNYVTPQYQPAAKALYKIINNLLIANQTLIKWINDFSLIDITENNKKEFYRFANEYEVFKIGPEFDKIRLHCHEINIVYKSELDGYFRQMLFKEKHKYEKTTQIFETLTTGDLTLEGFVNQIVNRLDAAIIEVKKDYKNGKQFQQNFTDEIENLKINLNNQINILRDLRQEFLILSGTLISG